MADKSHDLLLVAEDSDEDFEILQLLMQRMAVKNQVYRCTNGDDVLEVLYQSDSSQFDLARLAVILLDLNLPGLDGREVLEQVKQDQKLKEIPIVVFTTSSNPRDVEFCYQNGANGYLIKPIDAGELQKTVQAFVYYWLDVNTSPCLGKSD